MSLLGLITYNLQCIYLHLFNWDKEGYFDYLKQNRDLCRDNGAGEGAFSELSTLPNQVKLFKILNYV